MMFGDYQVAYAVQHAVVPITSGVLQVDPGGNGGVRIERGTGNGYSITACIGAGAATAEEAQRAVEAVQLSTAGNRVTVTNSATVRSWSVQLIIEAPAGAQIQAETRNGPIGINGVDGQISVRAQNGPISVHGASGQITATAVNGPISVTGSNGHFDLETQNGPIAVRLEGTRWDGKLDARAQNGPLNVQVPDSYTSGVEISSSGSSPWNCRVAACSGADMDRSWERRSRTLKIGSDPVVVRISTVNGPVTVANR